MFSLSKQVLNITRHARILKQINANAKLLYIRYDREQNRFYSADAVSCASEGYKVNNIPIINTYRENSFSILLIYIFSIFTERNYTRTLFKRKWRTCSYTSML